MKYFVFGLELLTTTDWIIQSGWSYHDVNHWFVDYKSEVLRLNKTIIYKINVILYWKQIERSSRVHKFVGKLRKKWEEGYIFSWLSSLLRARSCFQQPVWNTRLHEKGRGLKSDLSCIFDFKLVVFRLEFDSTLKKNTSLFKIKHLILWNLIERLVQLVCVLNLIWIMLWW